MATPPGSSSSVPSLPQPRPKSSPKYPDLYGKRRETAKVQMLEREIGFFEEELKSVEGLQPASRCCKDVTDFVVASSDPLIPVNRKNRKSCRFWKWLCGLPCFNFSWICCCCCNSGFSLRLKMPPCRRCCCCDCNLCKCRSCKTCLLPKLRCCCACPRFISCCCSLECCSLADCVYCCRWVFCRPRCPKQCCSNCAKNCCNPCCLFL